MSLEERMLACSLITPGSLKMLEERMLAVQSDYPRISQNVGREDAGCAV